jgi:hypothetical protein
VTLGFDRLREVVRRYTEAPAERGRASASAAEKWTIGEDGLIAASLGHFVQDEYDRQLAG